MHFYRGFLFTVCLYRDLLSYSLFFGGVKFCLCSPLSKSYVVYSIGLSRFRRVLDTFTNYPTRTSIHARIFKKTGYMASSLSLLMNVFGNRFAGYCK